MKFFLEIYDSAFSWLLKIDVASKYFLPGFDLNFTYELSVSGQNVFMVEGKFIHQKSEMEAFFVNYSKFNLNAQECKWYNTI